MTQHADRSLAIRHVSGHRLVALLEIVSPANKDRARHVEEFASKVVSALEHGVHVLVVDLFPPGPADPFGMHGVIRQQTEESDAAYDLPADEPLTLASYAAGPTIEAYLEHVAGGAALPDMPLLLRPDLYVSVPLEGPTRRPTRGCRRTGGRCSKGRRASRRDLGCACLRRSFCERAVRPAGTRAGPGPGAGPGAVPGPQRHARGRPLRPAADPRAWPPQSAAAFKNGTCAGA